MIRPRAFNCEGMFGCKIKCSSSRTSRRLLTNIAPAQLRFGENITPLALTLAENMLTFV